MAALKNMRHEWFAREYVKTGVGAEAYRRVYPKAHPRRSAIANASRLLTYDTIDRRVGELREQAMKRSDITIEKILADYQRAMNMAEALEKPGDVTNAATAQAKLVGLLIDRREVGGAGEYDNMASIEAVLSRVAETEGPKAAMAMAQAFGLEFRAETTEPDPEPVDLSSFDPPSGSVN
tara:strand:+ start:34 stop:570 length:537 start_codon:yes stop_codon:yes gene_type:complete